MNPKVIAIACDTFAPDHNGTATFAKHLACELQERNYEVHVIAPATSRLYGTFREKHDGVALVVHRLKSYRLPFQPTQRFVSPLGLTRKIRGLIGAIKPDVVHIQSHINIGHHAAIAAQAEAIRLVATNHLDAESLVENALLVPNFVKRFLAQLLLKDAANVFKIADAVASPSKRAAHMLEKVAPQKRVFTISGGVKTDLYSTLPDPDQHDRSLLYVGRLDREKHVYVLLEALARTPKELGIKLKVVGTGSQEHELVRLAAELGISNQVQFLGELSDEEVIAELGKTSAFVMPSTQELQSMATLEAMAAGRPILAADAMVLPTLVTNERNGFLFKPDSPSDLALRIVSLFNTPKSEFLKLSKESRTRAKQFELDATIANYELLYQGLEPNDQPIQQGASAKPVRRVGNRIVNLVKEGSQLLGRGANGVLERLDGARGAVSETFEEVRFTIERRSRRATKRISASLRKALERIRRDD